MEETDRNKLNKDKVGWEVQQIRGGCSSLSLSTEMWEGREEHSLCNREVNNH